MMEQFDSMGVPAQFTYALETKVRNLIDGTISLATGARDRMVP